MSCGNIHLLPTAGYKKPAILAETGSKELHLLSERWLISAWEEMRPLLKMIFINTMPLLIPGRLFIAFREAHGIHAAALLLTAKVISCSEWMADTKMNYGNMILQRISGLRKHRYPEEQEDQAEHLPLAVKVMPEQEKGQQEHEGISGNTLLLSLRALMKTQKTLCLLSFQIQ